MAVFVWPTWKSARHEPRAIDAWIGDAQPGFKSQIALIGDAQPGFKSQIALIVAEDLVNKRKAAGGALAPPTALPHIKTRQA